MDQLKKLREKKAQMGKMHPMEQKAKMGVVSDLQKMAEEAMGDRLKGMGKVTVASDSPEGLEHGLEHAHDIIKHLPEALDDSHPDLRTLLTVSDLKMEKMVILIFQMQMMIMS